MVASDATMRAATWLALLAAIAAALFCGLAVAVETNAIAGFDETVRIGLHGLASPGLTACVEQLSLLGTVFVLAVFGVAAGAVLIRAGRRDGAVLLAVIMAGALVLENALKLSFQRARPLPYFGSAPATYGFPSGHALFSLCFYGGLAVLATRPLASAAMKTSLWIATTLLVLGIGATRIYLGVHYPSDVLGGYLVAIAWIAIVLSIEDHIRP